MQLTRLLRAALGISKRLTGARTILITLDTKLKTPATNLKVLKKTRRKPEAGDIFVFQLETLPDRYFFGRVVATDTTIGGFSGNEFKAVLIYLYRTSSAEKTDIPPLLLSDLLVPPIGTNNLPWTLGFFEVIKSGQNISKDLLPQHCFKNFRGWFVDEYGNRLQGPVEPVGINGVAGIGAIDIDISKALGLPLKVVQ